MATQPSPLRGLVRHASLWYSFVHAMVALVLVPLAVGSQVWELHDGMQPLAKGSSTTQALWAWVLAIGQGLSAASPTVLHQFIAAFSGCYYAVDFVLLFCDVHPLSWTHKAFFTLHHIFCFAGLTVPAFVQPSALDCTLAFVGFWLGEISNPPRCVVDLLQYQIDVQHDAWTRRNPSEKDARAGGPTQLVLMGRSYAIRSVKRQMISLTNTHVAMFIAFRFVGVHYFLKLVWPYAALECTRITGGVTLVLSLAAVVAMLQGATAASPIDEQQAKTDVVAPGETTVDANGRARDKKQK